MTSLVGAITLLVPLDVLARKVILKLKKINVQVTLSNPLFETLRYFITTSLSNQFPLFVVFH